MAGTSPKKSAWTGGVPSLNPTIRALEGANFNASDPGKSTRTRKAPVAPAIASNTGFHFRCVPGDTTIGPVISTILLPKFFWILNQTAPASAPF